MKWLKDKVIKWLGFDYDNLAFGLLFYWDETGAHWDLYNKGHDLIIDGINPSQVMIFSKLLTIEEKKLVEDYCKEGRTYRDIKDESISENINSFFDCGEPMNFERNI